MDWISQAFGGQSLLPHGFCLTWNPALLWTLVVSDAVIALSYFSIPFALWYFAKISMAYDRFWNIYCSLRHYSSL